MTQTDDVLRLLDEVLGPAVLAVVLHGSAVMGGLRPDSDLDLFVVTSRSITDPERAALVAGLLPMSGRGRRSPDDRSIELVSVVRDDVVPWRYPPVMDFLYGDWNRREYLAGMVPGREPKADVVTLLVMVRGWGRALVGPPPAALLDPVPPADLRRAIVAEVPGLLGDLASDTRNVLLTLARVWVTLATGEIRSKDEAAAWAMRRLPEPQREVLAHARSIYLGAAEERWSGALADGVAPCAGAMQAAILDLARDAG
jgi:streptomycin 3"-adenylyltransferase